MYSFSQNFEDVYIYRAFSEITDGFYIDAGAFDPLVDSVTKMFYDLGWSGINLEPGPTFPSLACRIRDLNLPYALTDKEGKIEYYYNASDPGTSTTAQSNMPSESSYQQPYDVVSMTLTSLVKAHAPDRHIHFLKLDIEGSEWDVLRSTDWHVIRPELIIVESSKPYTNIRRDQGWAEHMKSFDYEEVFFDGINTYYLRKESLFRRDAFNYPVNVLDGARKFDPVQHPAPNDLDSRVLINNISQEVARVVETGSSAVRAYLEKDLGDSLQLQKDFVAELKAEQSEYVARLRTIADGLPHYAKTKDGTRGGNSPEAVLDEIAQSVAAIINDREQQVGALSIAQQVNDQLRAAFEEQGIALATQAEMAGRSAGEAQLLAKRLAGARASRIPLLEITERVAAARIESNAAKHDEEIRAARKAIEALDDERRELQGVLEELVENTSRAQELNSAHNQEIERDIEMMGRTSSLTSRVQRWQSVSAWQGLIPYRNRFLVGRANSFRDEERWLEAAEGYAKAYALRPHRGDLCLQMANMLTHLEAFPLAELAYREALTKAPGNGLIYLHLGHMFETSGRRLRAYSAYRKSAQLSPGHLLVDQAMERIETWFAQTVVD